jgi:hypothetical protein
MSRIVEAIGKLESILDGNVCFSRREGLQEVLNLLKEEQASSKGFHIEKMTPHPARESGW